VRISEEIDALEVMAVPSVPYLITTRMIAGVIAIIPMYSIGLLGAYLAARFNVTVIFGLPGGTYDHYFDLFLPASDVLWSYVKVIAFAVVIILIHCHYGYRASGGPAGVGVAVGRAVRASIVSTAILDFFLTLAIFGTETSVRVAG
jgi:phospholipid/cholesterol/gamma-HCH transport system permease protein